MSDYGLDEGDLLENAVEGSGDPPLNLVKVARDPLRQRLSALRKQYGSQNTAKN